MAEVTVNEFAKTVGIPVDRLLNQLQEAGVATLQAGSLIGDEDKHKLLSHLRSKHGDLETTGAVPRRVTLNRKSVSEVRLGSGRGASAKTVTVEVRKKRTYVKRSVVMEEESQRLEQEKAEREAAETLIRKKEDELKQQEALRLEEAARKAEEQIVVAEPELPPVVEEAVPARKEEKKHFVMRRLKRKNKGQINTTPNR